jgi:hypothetical protein
LIEKDYVMNVNKPASVLAMTMSAVAASALVAFGNPANASAAEQTKPTAGQCALISNMSNKQVLDLARQSDQRAAFGKLLIPDAIKQCPVTVSYQELRRAINGAQINSLLAGGAAAAVGLVAGVVVAGVVNFARALRGRE